MEENQTLMIKPNKRLIGILVVAATLLFIPFIAMLFTNEVKWMPFDFLVAAVLLFGTGLVLEFILRKVRTVKYKIIASIVLFVILFLIWVELAVGIFGTPFAGH